VLQRHVPARVFYAEAFARCSAIERPLRPATIVIDLSLSRLLVEEMEVVGDPKELAELLVVDAG
jgi:hypothetical protein